MKSATFSNTLTNVLAGKNVLTQLAVPQLVEKVLERGEGILTSTGAVRAETGKYTYCSLKINILLKKLLQKMQSIGVL